jgi:WD40 repeat protein
VPLSDDFSDDLFDDLFLSALELECTLQRDSTVYALRFSPAGDLLASGGGDKQVSLWSRHGRLLSESPALDGAIKALGFSASGTDVACASGKEVRSQGLRIAS